MAKKHKKIAALALACGVLLPSTVYGFQLWETLGREYTHERIIGRDRYETGIKVAKRIGNLDTIILTNGTDMADGLSASALSGKIGATIVPIKKNSIPSYCKDTINKAKNVYIIGEKNAISNNIENMLKDNGKNVTRIGGKDRCETSRLVAKNVGSYSEAYVVNGFDGQADAMSISAVSAKYKKPIILTNNKNIEGIKENVSYTIIGGDAVVSTDIENKISNESNTKAKRIAGDNRYETNKKVIKKFYKDSEKVAFANGKTLVDALSGAYFAKDMGIVLVDNTHNHDMLKYKDTIQIGGMNFDIPLTQGHKDEPETIAKLELLNTKNPLNLKAIPQTNEIALKSVKPHTFTVKNSGNVDLNTKICLHIAKKTMPIPENKINVRLEDKNGKLIIQDTLNKFTEEERNAFVLKVGESRDYKLFAWVDESATNEDVANGMIDFRVNVIGNQIVE